MNFSKEYRPQCIVRSKSFVAFLPFNYFTDGEGPRNERIGGFNRIQKLSILHLSISTALTELKEISYSGLSCRDLEGNHKVYHPCIASYCSDMPEAKDPTSVRSGNRSLRNCHRCLEESKRFNSYTRNDQRKSGDTVFIIEEA